jgi:hypothetical protein
VNGTLARDRTHVLQPHGQPVALALELSEREQARSAEGLLARQPRGRGGDVREAGSDDLRELALQARDLLSQRAPRGGLVELLDRWSAWRERHAAVDRQLLGLAHASGSSSYAVRADSTSAQRAAGGLATSR